MMKTGIDLVEISRIEKSLQNPRFLTRVFSEEERMLFSKKGKSALQSIAANFAAKEAFSKALGTGIRHFNLQDVSVLRKESGEPYFKFHNQAQILVAKSGLSFCVSLTHTDQYASAVVVAFPRQDEEELS